MASRKTFTLSLVYCGVLALPFLGTCVLTSTAVAQERRADDDDDDRDGGEDRRERWRSRWRDRGRDDDEREDRSSGDRSSSSEASSSSSSDTTSMSTQDYARSLRDQLDKNGNKFLDGDEVGQLRGKAAKADANNDKVVSLEELTAALSRPSTSSPGTASSAATSPGSPGSSSESREGDGDDDSERRDGDRDRGGFFGFGRGDRDRDSDDERSGDESKSGSASGSAKRVYLGTVGVGKGAADEKNARRTYRFTPAGERLPNELPGWFKTRDKNSDGQVLMSEYSRSWSSRMVTEFRRYDLNDDGVVTAKEAERK
jgi:hypothetical protein